MTQLDQHALDFLSGESLEGELLSARLLRGPLSAEETLRYAIQIGAALARAHGRMLVHRSLSADSIVLTETGAHIAAPSPDGKAAHAPYRSPEEVRGEAADSRSDIFAFGALLYEMAGGKKAYPGEGPDLDRQILESRPVLDEPAAAALSLESVIAGCLQLDPNLRRQRMQNAVIELKLLSRVRAMALSQARKAASAPAPSHLPAVLPAFVQAHAPRPARFRGWIVVLAAVLLLAVIALGALFLYRRGSAPPVYSFNVPAPENASYPGTPAISPDGRHLTFAAMGPQGERMLFLRPLDEERSRPIAGTEGAFAPFWSFDSKSVGFFAGKMLRRVSVSGGPVADICPADLNGGGGAWNRDDTIVFAPNLNDGLYRVPAGGGRPEPLLKLNPARAEFAFLWPQFLPDQQSFVFFGLTDSADSTGVYLASLGQREPRFLFPSETNAVYSSVADSQSRKHGYLLYMRDRALMGQPFDASSFKLSGEPVTLRDGIGSLRSLARAPISVSNTAVLVYQTVGKSTRQMVWMSRDGRQLAAVKDPGEWGPPRISPDGSRAAVAKFDAGGKSAGLWLLDSAGNATPFSDPSLHEGCPVWSPDGTRLAFFVYAQPSSHFDIFWTPVTGGTLEPLYKSDLPKCPTDWSHDGRFLLFTTTAPGSQPDVWAYSTAERRAGPVLATIFAEAFASLSPDGRWLAYQSDETGRREIYVQSFEGITSGTKRRWTVSTGGGAVPHWRADGRELFYLTAEGRMMSVPLHATETSFDFDTPQPLFQARPVPKVWNLYDAAPDGQRFLLNLPLEVSDSSSIQVVTSWTEQIKN